MADQINTSSVEKKRKSTHQRTSSRRKGVRLTKEQAQEAQETFLKSFANSGNVRAACMAAGIDRSTVRHWEEHDEQFSMRYNLSKEDVNDAIRAEIFRRAMYGEEEIVTSMGKPVYEEIPLLNKDGTPRLDSKDRPMFKRGKMLTHKRKSDILLMFQAKARMPEYREKQQVEMSGPNGGPLQTVEIYKIRIPDNGRNTSDQKGGDA